jgi:nicotinamidase-related amidase
MNTLYQDIINVNHIASYESRENMGYILALGQSENITPASQDKKRSLLLAIDVQNDFMEGIGSLAVQGSKGDVQRLTQWMYQNMESLTQVICSLDCHSMMQIFHPVWWLDHKGDHPEPFTIISYKDVAEGVWRAANGESERSLEYLRNLESDDKKQLCIWPYHCLEGTAGAKLESEFTKMLYFHTAVRSTSPTLIYKGQNPYTEMYGIIKAEYDRDNYINHEVLNAVSQYDEIFIAGQAASHCVLASLTQILEHFGDNLEITSRITLLEDCMSPIVGFEMSTRQQFEVLKEQYGIRISKSTDITL